jgi:hypothetical protein
VFFLGVKQPDYGVGHPPPSSNDVKERAEMFFYCLSEPPRPVLANFSQSFNGYSKSNLENSVQLKENGFKV